MADGSQVTRERICEFATVREQIVVAVFLVVLDHLDHLRGHVRIDVVFVELCADGVDGLLPDGGIQLDVIKLRTGRKRADNETPRTRRLGVASCRTP